MNRRVLWEKFCPGHAEIRIVDGVVRVTCYSEDTLPFAPSIMSLSSPTSTYYGIVRASVGDWPTIAAELGGDIIELNVTPRTTDANILAALNEAQALGFHTLLHIYDGQSNTQNPWSLVEDQWSISQRGQEILQLVEGHPAVWAIYQLHEPFDSSTYHADADAQRALYGLLKQHTTHCLYTDIASLARPAETGEVLSDGMCDYCATFPTTFRGEWTSEQCLAETFKRMDADLATQAAYMPNSQLVFLINTYQLGDGARYRLPTPNELRAARAHALEAGVPVLYYPWQHGSYNETLSTTPELWPVIAEDWDPPEPPPEPPPQPPPEPPPQPPPQPPPASTYGLVRAYPKLRWSEADRLDIRQHFEYLQEMGISTIIQAFSSRLIGTGTEPDWLILLDEAQQAGIRVVARLLPLEDWDGLEFDLGLIESFFAVVQDHPALLAYLGLDEPFERFDSVQLQEWYAAVKSLAPELLIAHSIANPAHYDRSPRWPNRDFASGICDICVVWYYPVRYIHGRPILEKNLLRRMLQENRRLLDRQAPETQLWFLGQAFAQLRHPRQLRMPTPKEMELIYNIATGEGVDGFLWYLWAHDDYDQVLGDPDMDAQRRAVRYIYESYLLS